MAIELFGLEPQDVVDELPSNMRAISATSEGLNTTKIAKWIVRGAGQLQALMERAGVNPASAAVEGSPSREVARNGVIAYALAKAMSLGMNPADPRIVAAQDEWAEAKRVLTAVPSSLGAVKPSETGTHTNVNMDKNRTLTFRNNEW